MKISEDNSGSEKLSHHCSSLFISMLRTFFNNITLAFQTKQYKISAVSLILLMSNVHADNVIDDHTLHLKEETHKIKQHKLLKLKERLSSDEETLKQHCRYESEIASPPPSKEIALTFDDGPDPVQTEFILSILRKYKVPASFFMIGEKVQAHAELVKLVQDSGYALIGNHSWSHPNFHDITTQEQATEIEKSTSLLSPLNPQKLFRYPYGNSTCETNLQLKQLDQKIVGWHIDSCDWAFDHKGSVDMKEALSCGVLPQNRKNYVEHVVSSVKAHNGGVILMHEIHANTLKSLEEIIQRLIEDGYVFKRLDDQNFQKFLR
ncbi:polysaccharide deacetylase family protein [Undibacterium sp. SXout7W]|uniref:polysaccharide deacetylase family protein n=1 Tax=Undibacterium sp. SXout7W TaxID=3413049 RepID=UPI003BF096CC